MNPTFNNLRPINLLLVEDSPTDLLMTREALERAKVLLHLHVVEDGIQTMEFLRRSGKYASAPRPDLILLDLNLPRKDGREVLAEIKSDPLLKQIPVVILTTSKADEDIARAYDSHANCFITKPVGFANFNEVMRSIEKFWFTVASLPP
ncbi:MAG TPA: response regulator [Planctomycetota bacterium]|jgi:two-component system response regulator|nr:response regulator [Planctomycetota bacterium]